MTRHTASATVPYSPQQMYDLVVDMKHYPDFLPWCAKARKYQEEEKQFLAEMTFSLHGFRETFQTVDRIVPGESVKISLLSGPFHHLENEWRFTPAADGGTRVDFFIDFKFKSKMLDLALGPIFSQLSKQMVEAFRKRAGVVYGESVISHSSS